MGVERLRQPVGHFRLHLQHLEARSVGDDLDLHVVLAEVGLYVLRVVERQAPLRRVVVAHLDDEPLLVLRQSIEKKQAEQQTQKNSHAYSSSSILRGQLALSRRDSARSARILPPVWQRAQ